MLDRRKMLATGAGAAALGVASDLAAGAADAQTISEMQDGQLVITLKKQFDADLIRFPERATSLGLDTGEHAKLKSRLDDYSLEFASKQRDETIERWNYLKLFNRDLLSNYGALSYDIVSFRLQLAIETDHRFQFGSVGGRMAPYVVSQLNGAYYSVPDFLANQHKIATHEDVDSYMSRLKGFATALDQQTAYLNHDVGQGVVPPDFVIAQTIGNLKKLRDQPAGASVLVRSVADRAKAKGLGDHEAAASQIFSSAVVPALDRQIQALQAVLPRATHDAGCWRLPDGDNYYEMALLASTTVKLTGDQVHQIGKNQVADLQKQLDKLLADHGMTTGTVGERIAKLNADPAQVYPNTDAGKDEAIAYLNTLVAQIRPKLDKVFNSQPKTPLEIRRVPPYIESGAPLGYYNAGSLDGARPGIYYINLRDTADWPKFGLPTLSYHEGIPGHHFQISLLHEMGDLPVYRKVGGFSAYTEGWALYAEQLASELGAYENDPLGRIGFYQSLLFRACRLVVDSGIHSKRWTREQGIKYLVDNCGRTAEASRNEVERYAAQPGQACSYKIGHAVISALREQARTKLGSGFDLKGFHNVVLKGGAMPLSLLEDQVNAWVRRRSLGATE